VRLTNVVEPSAGVARTAHPAADVKSPGQSPVLQSVMGASESRTSRRLATRCSYNGNGYVAHSRIWGGRPCRKKTRRMSLPYSKRR
jgi:hypothetical protein